MNKETLKESQSRLQAIIDTAIDGIITISALGIIETINPAAAKLFGYEPSEVIGKNIKILMPIPHRQEHDGYIHSYKTTGIRKIIGIGRDVLGLRKDGTTFPFMLSVAEVALEERKIFTGIIHDITDKRLAEEVQKALQKERELNELKSRFISLASHEFRTPLTTINSSASLIGRYAGGDKKDRIEKHANKIKNSVKNLTSILNDFLSLSKLEEGKTLNKPIEFNIEEFAVEIIESIEEILKPNQKINCIIEGIKIVNLDKKLLHHVFLNLLSNAIKYSEKDIDVLINVSENTCAISVKDEGIGIPKENQKELFSRFFRADNVGNIQGTGLGLNIVLRYVEIMKGTITFESELNQGTTFYILLPF